MPRVKVRLPRKFGRRHGQYTVTSKSNWEAYQARYNYTKSIEKIHSELKKKKLEEIKKLKEEEKKRQKELEIYQGKYTRLFWKIWHNTFGHLGEDWVFLAFLGIIVAVISYTVDKAVWLCNNGQKWLYADVASGMFAKWVAWVALPFCLIIWNVGLTHLVAPQAAGSGIPQIKTSLRGVFMKEVLTFRTLLVKWLGTMASIGSGLPLGKEGPLIHMSSIIVTKLSKVMSNFNSIYINESKKIEMLGAAWAVGVACTFNAPIGGVLFSVEITTAYYAVRNYWRGFFAAVWGATTYRLLLVWIDGAKTITAVFPTNYYFEIPYDSLELLPFAILGLICGFSGALSIWCKQHFDAFVNSNKIIMKVKSFNRFIYPAIVVLFLSSLTFPPGLGQFMASDLAGGPQVTSLFSNFSWTKENLTLPQQDIVSHWSTDWTSVYENLVIYLFYEMIGSIIANSLPIPTGAFIPNFRAGAALGRIMGELMHSWFPTGIGYRSKLIPGAYAAVGAAAFSGAVTHTMSVCVVLFEMTSSITYLIPTLIAVLIANGVARLLAPSIYDLVIRSKKLPYLPDLLPNTSSIYEVYVEDFMKTEIKYLSLSMNYGQMKELLISHKKIEVFPLVDHPQTMTLLGSITRQELIVLLDQRVGTVQRRQYLPTPMIDRHETSFENIEFIQSMRKRSVPHIDDSSDSEKEDDIRVEDNITTHPGMHEMKEIKVNSLEDTRDQIMKKWAPAKKTMTLPPLAPKSPLPERRTPLPLRRGATSLLNLDVPGLRVCDLPDHEQQAWEVDQLKQQVDFTNCRIDPAPFQLVERTSLLKVHSLFSLLAINFAYVTSIGKLVGVVGLKELRCAIEDANSGNPPKKSEKAFKFDVSVPPTPTPATPVIAVVPPTDGDNDGRNMDRIDYIDA
ncbi:chloride channel protein 2 isoform X2 [Diabrotica virgifera virgifera]|uniref:Chloride channel protein n=1 Tax=Diabrotica virgifera virgifera TaxID=50390 RepID=A0ABM5ICU4_DIAVI|nr:chloride channel protein 2 isoform X2 [Diabrotica virgifera virgifera]